MQALGQEVFPLLVIKAAGTDPGVCQTQPHHGRQYIKQADDLHSAERFSDGGDVKTMGSMNQGQMNVTVFIEHFQLNFMPFANVARQQFDQLCSRLVIIGWVKINNLSQTITF